MVFDRITINPAQMAGVPCIRGMRIPVATVVHMVAEGMSRETILDDYPSLEDEDITQALHFAATAVTLYELPTRSGTFIYRTPVQIEATLETEL